MSDSNTPSDPALPDASDTIARLHEAAERRAKQRRSRSRADATASAEVEALRARCSSLDAQLAGANENNTRAVRDAEAKVKELVEARNQEREASQALLRERDTALEAARSSLALRDAELAKLSGAAKELEEIKYRVSTLGSENEQLRGQLRSANTELETSKEDSRLVEEAMAQLEQTQVTLNEVRTRADEEGARAAEAEAARDELQRANSQMVIDLGNARTGLASEREALTELKATSTEHIDRLGRELQEIVAVASDAERALVDSQAEAEVVMTTQLEQLNSAAERMANIEVELGQLQNELGSHRASQVATAEREAQLLERSSQMKQEFEALRLAAEEQLEADEEGLMREAELQAEIDLLRASRDELQQALDALVSDRAHTSDITVAQAELERSQRHVQELEGNLDIQRIELQQLQRDLEGARLAYDDATNQAEEMQAKLAANSRPIETDEIAAPAAEVPSESVTQYEAEMQMARQIIGNLETQCEGYEGRISALQREVRRLEAAIEELETNKHPHLRAVRQR